MFIRPIRLIRVPFLPCFCFKKIRPHRQGQPYFQVSVNNAVPILEKSDASSLLQAMQRGDESAFDTLFRAYYTPLCHYACPMTGGDMDEAEDIVQQVFVKFWEQRAALDVQWSVKAYLYKMVHNRCLNRMRDARIREQYKVHNAEQLERAHDPQPGAETELGERIQKALATLPTECRRVFELSRFEELKYREIADQLGISIKTVETQMGKALRLMRMELADYLNLVIMWSMWSM